MDIICYWDYTIKQWIYYVVDSEGFQIWDAEYYPNKPALKLALEKF